MPIRIPLLLTALALLISACATPVKTEYDREANFQDYQTFAWKMPEREGVRNPADDSAILDRRMARLLTQALEARGYRAVDASEADFLVTYRATTRQGGQRSSSGVSIGMGMGSGNVGGGVRIGGGGGSGPQSILILDVIDRREDMLVWRGWEEGQQRQDRWSEERLERLLDRLLKEFPPKG